MLASATGCLLLMAADLLLSALGSSNGLGFDSGGLGIAFGVAGILLGACFLTLDFKQVKDAIAYGAPREESWLAAFGLTATWCGSISRPSVYSPSCRTTPQSGRHRRAVRSKHIPLGHIVLRLRATSREPSDA